MIVKPLASSWDLSPLLNSDLDLNLPALQEEVAGAYHQFITQWKGRTDYLEQPGILAEALIQYAELERNFGVSGTFGYYFSLRSAQDQDNALIKAQVGKLTEFSTKLSNELQFFELRLATILPVNQQVFLDLPAILPYQNWLKRLFSQAKYVLSEREERILNLKYPSSQGNWKKLTAALLSAEQRILPLADGSKETVPFAQISKLASDQNKAVRDAACQAFNEILAKHLKVAEAELNALLGDKKVTDELRGYQQADSARHIQDDISTDVVTAMITAVSSRFDISKRYYRLKADLLGVQSLAYHERSLEYGGATRQYSYTEALALVRRAFTKLDPQFVEILDRLVAHGQIDVYPHVGKQNGAFCSSNLISQPTYILLNHTDQLGDVLTLAHELGHAINNELMREQQNALTFSTSLATAEVASTFMEDFVIQELLIDADDQLQLSLQMLRLDRDISTIFRQVAIYRFEQELHTKFRANGYVSKEEIGQLFLTHMAAYMGDAVSLDAGSENWWTYIGHIRTYFYVYSYAFGELISKSLQAMVRANPHTIITVKKFLSAGTSTSPEETFTSLGIDISNPDFWQSGVDEITERLNQVEQLYKKVKTK